MRRPTGVAIPHEDVIDQFKGIVDDTVIGDDHLRSVKHGMWTELLRQIALLLEPDEGNIAQLVEYKHEIAYYAFAQYFRER